MRIILRASAEKHFKDKGHVEGGFKYRPFVRRYSFDSVLLVILLMMYS